MVMETEILPFFEEVCGKALKAQKLMISAQTV
jgi:hypothetical protein